MKVLTRAEVSATHTWDLTALYADASAWERHLHDIENGLPQIAAFRGKLGESASSLRTALEAYTKIGRGVDQLYTYAHLKSDEDTSNAENLGRLDRALNIYTRFAAAASYITPELLRIDAQTLQRYLADELLAEYRRTVEEIVRYRPHTLSEDQEQLLAQAMEVFGACDKVFSQLNNADLDFGSVLVEGTEMPLTHGNFIVFMKKRHRDVRKRAWDQYYSHYASHKNTVSATLSGSIKRNVYLARVKNFPSALEQALFPDNVPAAVYDNLLNSVRSGLGGLHRYYELRKRVLNQDVLYLYDTYLPLVAEPERKRPFEESCRSIAAAFEPLGKEYCSVLQEGLLQRRWVDVFENKGKRSGAYSSGCYQSPPYILMNYKEDSINDLFTLAHEAGHSMHRYYSDRTQLYQDHSISIFVAEVASTLNEQLLLAHLKKEHADDKPMLAFLVNHQIEEIKATFFRQTMFAEFERLTHAAVERNEALTAESFRSFYEPLLQRFFGPAVTLQETDWLECLRIPHFYSAFYVYKYATGISAAIALAEKILQGDKEAVTRYLNFLKSGGSKHPIDLLRDAGVDMATPQPVESTIRLFDSLVSQLETLL